VVHCVYEGLYIYKWRLLFATKITIFVGEDSEHTYLLIVGGDELAVFGLGVRNIGLFLKLRAYFKFLF
jgi:hypothetical protein